MKFSFTTAFLTLSAVSVVFAAPPQDESAPGVIGNLTFDRYDIRGLVNGKSIIGKSFHDFRDEVAVKGSYHFQELEDINGVFKAHIQDGAVFIQYYGTEAIFIGKTESHLKVDQFAGATKVLETESFRWN